MSSVTRQSFFQLCKMRRNLTKHLLVLTSLGWILTLLRINNQLITTEQLNMQLQTLNEEHTSMRLENDNLRNSLKEVSSSENDRKINRNNKTLPDHTNSLSQQSNFTLKGSHGSQVSNELLEKLSLDLMNLRNDVIEIQYFLSRRRNGWSQSERGFMDELVKHLWFQAEDSRDKLTKSYCADSLLKISDEVSKEIYKLQHERDCNDEKNKLSICKLQQPCGFGCQLHHITWCLIFSFGHNRTMVLDDSGWSYSSNGWDELFKPLSKCSYSSIKSAQADTISGIGSDPYLSNDRVIHIPMAASLVSRAPVPPQHLPSIPSKWANKIYQCHSAPSVWYAGHFTYYNTRPNGKLQNHVDQLKTRYNISDSYFGLHVRRSDKRSEAKFHDLWEYMEFVKPVRHRLNGTIYHIDNHIYLATDEPSVLEKEAKNFSDFKFFGDSGVAKKAGSGSNRYAAGNILWLLTDMQFLAKSQYLVCTFSSQICRACYELMQVYRRTEDAGWRYQSLDDLYYYAGQGARFWHATSDHTLFNASKGEIPLRKGERLRVHGNHWDGYSKVTRDEASGRPKGLVPAFKTKQLPVPSFNLGR